MGDLRNYWPVKKEWNSISSSSSSSSGHILVLASCGPCIAYIVVVSLTHCWCYSSVISVPPTVYNIKNVTQSEGHSATLACLSWGDPPPQMTYRKEGNMKDYVLGPNVNISLEYLILTHLYGYSTCTTLYMQHFVMCDFLSVCVK